MLEISTPCPIIHIYIYVYNDYKDSTKCNRDSKRFEKKTQQRIVKLQIKLKCH